MAGAVDPPSAGRRAGRRDFLRALERAVRHSVPEAARAGAELSVQPDRARSSTSTSTRRWSASRKKHDLIILSDLAYAEIYFDGEPPPSVLQVPGAIDVAVEFSSLSKTYSMPGWRMGFAVGNERLIAALARVKSYLDYGAFTPIQVAAAAALNGPQDCVEEIRGIYKRAASAGRDDGAAPAGPIPAPPASMFAWAPIPEPFRDLGSLEFRQAAARGGRGRGVARHRLRRVWRGLRAHRAGRERAAHPPGRAQRRAASSPPSAKQRCTTSSRSRRRRRRELASHDAAAACSRHRRPRHGRRGGLRALLRDSARPLERALRPADRGHGRVARATAQETAASTSPASLVRRSGRARRDRRRSTWSSS